MVVGNLKVVVVVREGEVVLFVVCVFKLTFLTCLFKIVSFSGFSATEFVVLIVLKFVAIFV